MKNTIVKLFDHQKNFAIPSFKSSQFYLEIHRGDEVSTYPSNQQYDLKEALADANNKLTVLGADNQASEVHLYRVSQPNHFMAVLSNKPVSKVGVWHEITKSTLGDLSEGNIAEKLNLLSQSVTNPNKSVVANSAADDASVQKPEGTEGSSSRHFEGVQMQTGRSVPQKADLEQPGKVAALVK